MAKKTFTIECSMEERWFPYFMSFLHYMQKMGNIGHSCHVGFYCDGDGDFRPTFKTDDFDPSKDYIEGYDHKVLCDTQHTIPFGPERFWDAG